MVLQLLHECMSIVRIRKLYGKMHQSLLFQGNKTQESLLLNMTLHPGENLDIEYDFKDGIRPHH